MVWLMVMKMCGLCVSKRHWSQHSVFSAWHQSVAMYNWYQNLTLLPVFLFCIIFLTILYSNNHNWFLLSLNISKQWIYLQCVVTIYTKSLAHICNFPCVDLFLLDQCVINVIYVCLSCLKVIGQYATWHCAHSWMFFFSLPAKAVWLAVLLNFLQKCFHITNFVKVMIK